MFVEVFQRPPTLDQVGYLNRLGVVAQEHMGAIRKE